MKLLLDENLTPRLIPRLSESYPGSAHVNDLLAKGTPDTWVWAEAGRLGFALLSKDSDFRERAFLHGGPPKVIWLSVGNAGTAVIATLLNSKVHRIRTFLDTPDDHVLVLFLPPES
jgi:predicted nuclease of predicted toxin-antitoxin system